MVQLRTQATGVESVAGHEGAGTVTLRGRNSKNDGFKTPFSVANGPDANLTLHVDNADAYGEFTLGAEYIVTIESADAYSKRIAREQKPAADESTKTPTQAAKP